MRHEELAATPKHEVKYAGVLARFSNRKELDELEQVLELHPVDEEVSPLLDSNIGGIVFGPRRRSFATKIQNKVYALAYRTAISHRFSKGQLLLTHPQFLEYAKTKMLLNLIRQLKWTRKAGGGTLFVTGKERKNLVKAASKLGQDVIVKRVRDVKVRDLLLMGRVVFERRAFEWLMNRYDVVRKVTLKVDPIRDYERLVKLL
jgi:large subunit ribosomal protein L4